MIIIVITMTVAFALAIRLAIRADRADHDFHTLHRPVSNCPDCTQGD